MVRLVLAVAVAQCRGFAELNRSIRSVMWHRECTTLLRCGNDRATVDTGVRRDGLQRRQRRLQVLHVEEGAGSQLRVGGGGTGRRDTVLPALVTEPTLADGLFLYRRLCMGHLLLLWCCVLHDFLVHVRAGGRLRCSQNAFPALTSPAGFSERRPAAFLKR